MPARPGRGRLGVRPYQALAALAKAQITAGQAPRVEALLTRKAPDLRRGALSLLLAQPDVQARSSAQRLLASKDPLPRVAGLEVLQQMVKKDLSVPQCRMVAADFRASAPKTTEAGPCSINSWTWRVRSRHYENGLGLFDPAQCSPRIPPTLPEPPKKFLIFSQKPEPLITPAARALPTRA